MARLTDQQKQKKAIADAKRKSDIKKVTDRGIAWMATRTPEQVLIDNYLSASEGGVGEAEAYAALQANPLAFSQFIDSQNAILAANAQSAGIGDFFSGLASGVKSFVQDPAVSAGLKFAGLASGVGAFTGTPITMAGSTLGGTAAGITAASAGGTVGDMAAMYQSAYPSLSAAEAITAAESAFASGMTATELGAILAEEVAAAGAAAPSATGMFGSGAYSGLTEQAINAGLGGTDAITNMALASGGTGVGTAGAGVGLGLTEAAAGGMLGAGTTAAGGITTAGTTAAGGTPVTTPTFNWSDPSTYPWGNILGTGATMLGGYLQGESASDAAQVAANAQIEAARIAAEASKFKPVGVTTRFGESQFGYDAQGNLISAGYQLSPEIKAQQDVLMGMISGQPVTPGAPGVLPWPYQGAQAATSPMGTAARNQIEDPAFTERQQALFNQQIAIDKAAGLYNPTMGLGSSIAGVNPGQTASALNPQYQGAQAATVPMGTAAQYQGAPAQYPNLLTQYQGAQAATVPMGTAAQTMFGLGQGYLQTSPQAQAAQYMAEQQALLAPGRERELAQLQAQMQAQGRGGLAVGGTSTGMMAANPQLEAYYNAKRMQDLQLAAQATLGGQQYATFGAGMVGAGGQMLQDMYGTQTAAYAPYQTALGGATTLEALGQQPMDIGTAIGAKTSTAAAQAGMLQAQGMQGAAQTMLPANAYNPWAAMLTGAGQAIGQYNQPATTPQPMWFNPYTGQQLQTPFGT